MGERAAHDDLPNGDGLIDNEMIELSSRQKKALVCNPVNAGCVGDVLDRIG